MDLFLNLSIIFSGLIYIAFMCIPALFIVKMVTKMARTVNRVPNNTPKN